MLTSGRFPTVVERTPYNKDDVASTLIDYYVSRGYGVVIQDVRGRYKSEGHWRPIRDDGPDGVALLRWIGLAALVERESWLDGDVIWRRHATCDGDRGCSASECHGPGRCDEQRRSLRNSAQWRI